MDDFKSYAQNTGGGTQKAGGGDDPRLNSAVEMAKMMSRAMNGKSAAQIMQTVMAEAERGKREGTLTNADLDNFYSALAPILDGAKRRKLKEVITRLKGI